MNSTRYFYKVLFQSRNTKLYEWNQSVLHGKVALTDDNWATVGSYNLNMLSAFRSIELNAVITDNTFVRNMRAEMDGVMDACDGKSEERRVGKECVSPTRFRW